MMKKITLLFTLLLSFQIQFLKAQSCSGNTNLTAPAATFDDGSGSAANYTDNNNCSWLIQPAGATSITITFDAFETDPNDTLKLYDGNSAAATLVGSYSGFTVPASFTSTGGALFLVFTSDTAVNATGWQVTYTSCPVASPTITSVGSLFLCNSSVTLNSSVAQNILWSNGDTAASISVSQGGNYYVVSGPGTVCADTSNFIAVVDSTPIFVVGAFPSVICAGGSSQLSALGNSLSEDFDPINPTQWTIVGGVESNVCGSVSGNGLYFDGAGVRTATTQALNVGAGGTIDFHLKISNQFSPCEDADAGEEVVLEYSVNGGTSYTIINTYVTTGPYDNITPVSEVIPVGAQTSATIFQWRQLSNSGSTFDNWVLDNVNVNGSGGTYAVSWSPSTGLTGTTIPNPIATLNATQLYTVTVTNGGCVTSDTISVNVGPAPVTTITLNGDTSLCTGESVNMTSSTGLTYLWSTGDTLANVLTTTAGDYFVTVDYGYNCVSTSDTVSITVNPYPSATITTPTDTTICSGSPITLDANTGTGLTYQWYRNNLPLTGSTNSTYTATEGGLYSVIVTNAFGCSLSSANTQLYDISPVFFLTSTPFAVCAGDSVQLNAVGTSLSENFDPINSTNWVISGGIPANTCGAISGNALFFDGATIRSAATNPMNVLAGGNINFAIQIANGVTPCEMADAGEEVVLEYSIDNGITWTNIATYATGGVYANITPITVPIPAGAQTASTTFQWRQLSNSGTSFDNWSLDDISINGSTGAYTYLWSPASLVSSTTIDNPMGLVDTVTSFIATVTTNGCAVTDTLVVGITNPVITPNVTNPSTQTACDGSATVIVTGGTPPYNYAWFPNPPAGQGTATISNLCYNNYTVVVADATGCNSSLLISIGSGVGLNEIATLEGVEIFPNPVKDLLSVNLPAGQGGAFEVVLSNVLGENLQTINTTAATSNVKLDLSRFAAGTYFVKVKDTEGKMSINRVVKD
jgi:hypothetical protein